MIKKYHNHTLQTNPWQLGKALHSKHRKHPFQLSQICNKDNFVAFRATYTCKSEISLEQ